MIVGDLFSGIGGFSLAAEWMGWRTAFFSEIDPYASRVLAHHWPDVPNLGDITRIDWSRVAPVDVLTGGFPCQPHSLAGKRAGSNDERDLFDEIIRAIDVLRPGGVVLENVPGLFTSDDGRFFGRVLGALAALGYDAEWRVLSASDVGAPHRRDRVWITAYLNGGRAHTEPQREPGRRDSADASGHGTSSRVADTDSRSARRNAEALQARQPEFSGSGALDVSDTMREGLARRGASIGVGAQHAEPGDARWWATEPDVGRVAHGVPARVDRLRCLGNSIVPACAYEIFQAVEGRMREAA